MEFILHRINTISDLKTKVLESGWGAEIDIRYHENELILEHDPFGHHSQKPELLKNYLKSWKDRPETLILNLKTEGIEPECIRLMELFQVKSWFFLDMSPPFLVQYMKSLKNKVLASEHLCVRYSEYEPLPLISADEVKWIWVDCFSQYPELNNVALRDLRLKGVKVCLVSPELQGHSGEEQSRLIASVSARDYDAVCTKNPQLWQRS